MLARTDVTRYSTILLSLFSPMFVKRISCYLLEIRKRFTNHGLVDLFVHQVIFIL